MMKIPNNHKILLKNYMEYINKGKLHLVLNELKNKNIKFDAQGALKLIITCCHLCHANNVTISEIELLEILKIVVGYMDKLSDDELTIYLRSIFFIVKHLLQKSRFDIVTKMKSIVIPSFIPKKLPEKSKIIYQDIGILLYNSIVNYSKTSDRNYVSEMSQLAIFILIIYQKLSEQTTLLDRVYNIILSLQLLQSDYKNYYLRVLKQIKFNGDLNILNESMKLFRLVFRELSKQSKCNEINECLIEFKWSLTAGNVDDICEVVDLLDICLWLVHDDEKSLKRSYDCLIAYQKRYGLTDYLRLVCECILELSSKILHMNDRRFIHNKSTSDLMILNRIIFTIVDLCMSELYHCNCCSINKPYDNFVSNCSIILQFAKIHLQEQNECVMEYMNDLSDCMRRITTGIKAMIMANCEKWKNRWHEFGIQLFNTSFMLYNRKDEKCLIFLTAFIKNLINFEGNQPKIFTTKNFTTALSMCADMYFTQKIYDKCLTLSALCLILKINQPDLFVQEMLRWINVRIHLKKNNESIQHLTIVNTLEIYRTSLDEFYPNFKMEPSSAVDVLCLELECYKNKWNSKTAMKSVLENLLELADAHCMAKICVKIWGQCDLQVDENFPQLLNRCIKKCEQELSHDIEQKLLLAHLYFIYHKYSMRGCIIKNCEEIEKTMRITNSQETVEELNEGNEVKCDIVSAYEPLLMSRYTKIMEHIDKALNLLTEKIDEKFTLDSMNDSLDGHCLYNLLMKMAHEYRLHLRSIPTLKCYLLALQIARAQTDQMQILNSINFLIEFSNPKTRFVQQLIDEGAEIASRMDSNENSELLIGYHISRANAYFDYDFDKSYKSYKKAKMLLKDDQIFTREQIILKMKLDVMCHKFVNLPNEFKIEEPRRSPIIYIYNAFKRAGKEYATLKSKNDSYGMAIFFEIGYELINLFRRLLLPRDLIAHTKEMVLIAQKLILPLRTTYLLDAIAFSELHCGRLDDCATKLTGIDDILLINDNHDNSQNERCLAQIDCLIEKLACEFNGMTLETKKKAYTYQMSPSSPHLQVQRWKIPSFFTHEDACQCICCTCVEYQLSLLKKTYLDAMYHEFEGRNQVANEYYLAGLKMYDYFKLKAQIYLEKTSKVLPTELIPDYLEIFFEASSYVLLEFGNHLMRTNKISSTEITNNTLIKDVEPKKKKYLHVFNDALFQKLNIISSSHPVARKVNFLSVDEGLCNNLQTTPKSKQSKAKTPSPMTPIGSIPVKRFPKAIKFNLDENIKPEIKSPQAELVQSMLTPAPSTSQIRVHTRAMSKRLLTDRVVEEKGRNSDGIVPTSPNAYTPSVRKVDEKITKDLRKRTKLLTEKLKQKTSKTSQIPKIVVNNKENTKQTNDVQTLAQDLKDSLNTHVENQIIRKTRRNRH